MKNNGDSFDIVAAVFKSFGYIVLEKPAKEDTACDMYVVGKNKSIKVEIKRVRKLQSGSWQSAPITNNQRSVDVAAIVFPNGYVFIEAMADYMAHCSVEGYRQFSWLKL